MVKRILRENIAYVRNALPYLREIGRVSVATRKEIREVKGHLQKLFDEAEVSRYDTPAAAEKILASGRFQSVIEREGERILQGREPVIGGNYTVKRLLTERELFGLPEKAVAKRPIYGVVSNGEDTIASGYGDVRFVFRMALRADITVTLSDSMNRLTSGPEPHTANAMFIAAMPLNAVAIEILGLNLVRLDISILLRCKSLDELRDLLRADYFEVQIHRAGECLI